MRERGKSYEKVDDEGSRMLIFLYFITLSKVKEFFIALKIGLLVSEGSVFYSNMHIILDHFAILKEKPK